MRVEHCGDLLVEPNLLRQQPSAAVSSHCGGQQTGNIQFSELNQLGVSAIGCKVEEYILDNVAGEQHGGIFGFTLNEEEWSLFSKSHLADLEPYERRKMCSLPKSFTPFSSTAVGEDGLECDRNFNGSASNSISLRKCESLNPTPSQYLINGNEPNNNNIVHPSSLSKIMLLQKSHEGFQEDEKENWLGDEGWNPKDDAAISESGNVESTDDSVPTGDLEKEGPMMWVAVTDTAPYQLQQNDFKEPDIEVDFLPSSRYPLPHSSTLVGTIGSHPNPIISYAADQAHCHQHQDLSTTQQTSFPSTIYNFHRHSIDPMCYAECYDEWNANIASLCENNGTDGTPVLYPDVLSMNGVALQPQQTVTVPPESRFVGYANYGRQQNDDSADSSSVRAVEEVNTLSTFLSKFDDKVAAIWGQQGRSALGMNNYLNVDGCISAASTPMGSSNPWGSPSSDISTIHGASSSGQHDFRFLQQQQQTKQMSYAADALLSGGYGFHNHHHDHNYHQCEQKPHHSANCNPSRIAIGDLTISPPKGNYNIMHSMKQYFGTAPPEGEYHIIKRNEATSSAEELEISFALINHDRENAGFVAFTHPDKAAFGDLNENLQGRDIDLNTVTKALDSIDLEGNDGDEEWEIVEACNKEKSQGYDSEDLLNSWKTHFRTIEQVEAIASARGIDLMESPVTTISVHQINPNLPEYRLFNVEIDGEYRVFNRPGQTLFPIKYKVFRETEKGNQTEDLGVDLSYSVLDSAYPKHATSDSDWAKYMSAPAFEFSQGTLGTLPRSTTPTVCDPPRTAFSYDCDNSVDFQSADWYNLSKGAEYNGMWGDWLSAEDTLNNTLLPGGGSGGEYCDSGVGGVGSRSEFYDDMFGEYEGDYENFSGIGFTFPGFVGTTDTDTDYGQFQDISGLTGCDSSSTSGKQGKASRRNKTRLRPCKYFFMEGSCRRGNDCKFSHDSVTCRYWAEGSCLKGQTCPYVHCFIEGKPLAGQDEFGLGSNVTEKQYHLESETDFPALSSTKNTMLSSRQPMTLGFSSAVAGEGIRRLEDSLESLTVFTDSNSSVVDEEVTETRRLFLFERLRASSPPSTVGTSGSFAPKDKVGKNKHNGPNGVTNHHKTGDSEHWSECASRTLSKSKSVGDANSSSGNSSWSRHHSVTRSNSHSSTTGMSAGIPVKEKRKKKKH